MPLFEYRPTVYVAGKVYRSKTFIDLMSNSDWSHVQFTARWPHMAHLEVGRKVAPTASDFAHFWTMDIQDVLRSDFVLLWAGPEVKVLTKEPYFRGSDSEKLRGGLVEAGAALATGKTVICVGVDTNHTWTYHPRVVRLPNLSEAAHFLRRYYIVGGKDTL